MAYEGNVQPQPRRLLWAALIFAAIAIALFLLVWRWPQLFTFEAEESPTEELSQEEKMQVLNELQNLNTEPPPANDERAAVLEQLSESRDESGFTEQEKMNVLQSLQNAQ